MAGLKRRLNQLTSQKSELIKITHNDMNQRPVFCMQENFRSAFPDDRIYTLVS